jgi:hypothetical protein
MDSSLHTTPVDSVIVYENGVAADSDFITKTSSIVDDQKIDVLSQVQKCRSNK